jgi:transposase
MWSAELLADGLIRSSFVTDTQTQEMRGLLRTRKLLIRGQSSHMLRGKKDAEDANIKLDSVFSDLMGQSGRATDRGLNRRRDQPRQTNQRKGSRDLIEAHSGRSASDFFNLHIRSQKLLKCLNINMGTRSRRGRDSTVL